MKADGEILEELKKKCSCGGIMNLVLYTTSKRGVEHFEEFRECSSCGKKTKVKEHHGKKLERPDFEWRKEDVR